LISQLGFARVLRSFHVHANSYLLPNKANVDSSLIKV
jgi:hypothetical protein